jgi:hypothetical protein
MTIKPGEKYKIYYAGKIREAIVTAIVQGEWGSVNIVWKYKLSLWGWSGEQVYPKDAFKLLFGETIESVEI